MKTLINYISSKTGINNKTLLEKDIILHRLLCELVKDKYFFDNYVFKGGTCLTKCYFGYYRFSEDLDFSWRNQNLFHNLSQKKIRKDLSIEINKIATILENISKLLELKFTKDKSNKKFIELGGSNKFATFKLWYKSSILNQEGFIKIQINYVEIFGYDFILKKAKPIIKNFNKKELNFLFPEQSKYLLFNPAIYCYDIREILIEKIRAILTRKGVKARDFIDVFLIIKKENINLKNYETQITKKVLFALKYQKYLQNLANFKLENFVLGEENKLLLKQIPKRFNKFLEKFHVFLNEIYKKLKKWLI